jgi:hypothetical protein
MTSIPAVFAADIPAACKPAFDAVARTQHVASREFLTHTGKGGFLPPNSEIIKTDDAMYVQVQGMWLKLPVATDQTEMIMKGVHEAKSIVCRGAHDEPMDGERATAYDLETVNEFGTNTVHVWVSKASGLPLHFKVETAGGAGEVQGLELRFEYKDVKAPDEAQTIGGAR